MIKITLTETYGGFNITGDYQDFLKLENAFNYFFIDKVTKNEESMQKRILEFINAMRNAYQENNLWHFKYCLPELITDIIIFKYFVQKCENDADFKKNYQEIYLFFSKVIASLKEMVSQRKYEKINELILKGHVEPDTYIKQWYDKLIIDYLNMGKSAREMRLAKVVEGICDWDSFGPESYEFIKEKVKDYCLEHKCREEDVVLEEYPKEIDW